MRLAIIDLGTNSIRFDVYRINPKGGFTTLHRDKLMVRLGQGVFLTGKLDAHAVRRTLMALQRFRRVSDALKVDRVIAFATSALREASDADRLLSQAKKKTNTEIRVISGAEEARLIALGLLNSELPKEIEKNSKKRFGLIDIGGGSTEVSICRGKKVEFAESFPLGTARLQQLFLKQIPPRKAKGEKDPIRRLRRQIKSVLLSKMIAEDWPAIDRMVGSSGTVRAVSRILKKSAGIRAIEKKELSDLVKKLSTMNTTQLLGVPGMESKRVDMILAGTVLLDETMDVLGAKKVFASEAALRDGILFDELRGLRRATIENPIRDLNEVFHIAVKFGVERRRILRIQKAGERLFKLFAPHLKIKDSWQTLFIAALLLKDVGEQVSYTLHDEHAYYIVKNLDLSGFEKWEIELIAQLCRMHERPKNGELVETAFWKEKQKVETFWKLLGLVMLADALDSGQRFSVASLRRVTAAGRKLRIGLNQKQVTELESLNLDQKQATISKLTKKKFEFVRT